MSKKNIKLIILILIGLIIIAVLSVYLFLNRQDINPNEELITEPFPVGGFVDENGDLIDSNNLDEFTIDQPVDDLYGDTYFQGEREFELKGQINRLTFLPANILNIEKNDSKINLQYIIRGLGNIQQVVMDGNMAKNTPIYTSVFPNIYRSHIYSDADNDNIILQYTEDLTNKKNIYLKLSKSNIILSEETKLDERIIDFSISPDGQKIFYSRLEDDTVKGIVSDWNFFSEQVVFESKIKNWNLKWINNNLIAILNKPSYYYDSYLYFIDLNTGIKQKMIGPKRGLNTTFSPGGQFAFLSYYEDDNLISQIFDVEAKTFKTLGIKTLADKCTWIDNTDLYCAVSKLGDLKIDDWYMGSVLSEDTLWKIDSQSGQEKIAFSFPENIKIDVSDLKIIDNYIFISNKYDSSIYLIITNERRDTKNEDNDIEN